MRNHLILVTALAASIAAAMGSTAAMAATADQLPGQGRVVSGHVSVGNLATGTMSLNISGPAVINWGAGTTRGDINAGGVAGFNIGSAADVTFNGSAGASVLNIDSSGNPSQILGALTARGTDVFVANRNGIVVGAKARIVSDGAVGLITDQLRPGTADGFDGSVRSVAYGGHGGDVTVLSGASFAGGGTVLVAGGDHVNVDLGAFAGAVTLRAGRPSSGSGAGNAAASLTVSGQQRGTISNITSAGSVTNQGVLSLSRARIDGQFTNTGTLTLANGFAITGRLVNRNTVDARGDTTVGGLANEGNLTTAGVLTVRGGLTNAGHIASPDYHGEVRAAGTLTNTGRITGVSYVGVTQGNLVNSGAIRLVDREDFSGTVGAVSVRGGDLTNSGAITSVGDGAGTPQYSDLSLFVLNGNIRNQSGGRLADFGDIATGSDTHAPNFRGGADYSISNAGTIAGNPSIDANASARQQSNSSTGSFVNTGLLDVRAADAGSDRGLWIDAWNDLDLGGRVTVDGQALGSAHSLDGMLLEAANGKLTIATPLVFHADGRNSGAAYLTGRKVRIAANLVGLGNDAGIYVTAGRTSGGGYAYSIAPGAKVSAGGVYVSGQ